MGVGSVSNKFTQEKIYKYKNKKEDKSYFSL